MIINALSYSVDYILIISYILNMKFTLALIALVLAVCVVNVSFFLILVI